MSENKGELIIYQTEDGLTKIDVRMDNDTVWLSLEQMAELFQRDKSTISRHIKNVFQEGELTEDATVANFATVQSEGDRQVTRNITYYNLDVIISVGYLNEKMSWKNKNHQLLYILPKMVVPIFR